MSGKPGRSIIRVKGRDTVSFLQGLVTSDMRKLEEKRSLYAALLTPQGKYLFDFLIYAGHEEALIDINTAREADFVRRLSMYRLRAEVEITTMPELGVFAAASGEEDAFPDPRNSGLPWRKVARRDCGRELEEDEELRIRLCIPGENELIPDKSYILENNFEEINGVDFNKGCYIGQEVTARMKHRGAVKRKLFALSASSPLPEAGARVTCGGAEAGELTSSLGNYGIARLSLPLAAETVECGGKLLRVGE